ncbi:DNA gyrase inhibitor YacG [uncultured Devosia sp.]|uniref:DNA gyrase inhibitor YacG n=1 Tax=uncultured Devosia sp. TaxID=211434 RepID=UPI0035CB9682
MAAPVIIKPCPICGKPAQDKFRPFCSARCADVDLNRWLTGSYVIPGDINQDDSADDPSAIPSHDPEDDNI